MANKGRGFVVLSRIAGALAFVALSACIRSGTGPAKPIETSRGEFIQTREDLERFGQITIDGAVIRFGGGLELYTAPTEQESNELAEAALFVLAKSYNNLPSLSVEVRRVVDERAIRDGGLCGAERPSFVALVHKPRTSPGPAIALVPFRDLKSPGAKAADACEVHYLATLGPGSGDPIEMWQVMNDRAPGPY